MPGGNTSVAIDEGAIAHTTRELSAAVPALADLVVDESWNASASNVDNAVSFGRRARLHLTKAAASLVMHQVGLDLRARAALPGGEGLDELVDGLRVGVVRGQDAGA